MTGPTNFEMQALLFTRTAANGIAAAEKSKATLADVRRNLPRYNEREQAKQRAEANAAHIAPHKRNLQGLADALPAIVADAKRETAARVLPLAQPTDAGSAVADPLALLLRANAPAVAVADDDVEDDAA